MTRGKFPNAFIQIKVDTSSVGLKSIQNYTDTVLFLFFTFLLTVREKLADGYKKVHCVFTENLATDVLTELLLLLSDGWDQGYTERPLWLANLIPGRFGPQPGPDEGEQRGEQPLGAD